MIVEFAVEQNRTPLRQESVILLITQDRSAAERRAERARLNDTRFPITVKQRLATYTEWVDVDQETA